MHVEITQVHRCWFCFSCVLFLDAALRPSPSEAKPPEELSLAAKNARLRRLCQKKPSGRQWVPDWLCEEFKSPALRPELLKRLEEADWDKEPLMNVI